MITIYFHTIYSFILYLRKCRSLNLLYFQMMKLEFSPNRKLKKKKGLNDRHRCLHNRHRSDRLSEGKSSAKTGWFQSSVDSLHVLPLTSQQNKRLGPQGVKPVISLPFVDGNAVIEIHLYSRLKLNIFVRLSPKCMLQFVEICFLSPEELSLFRPSSSSDCKTLSSAITKNKTEPNRFALCH